MAGSTDSDEPAGAGAVSNSVERPAMSPAPKRGALAAPLREARGFRRHATAVSIAVIGVALSVAASAVTKRREDDLHRAQFERRAGELALAIARRFQMTREVVLSVPALFEASISVEPYEFQTFVRPALERHPSLAALEWAPFVRDAERAAFEAKVRAEGFLGFEIREPGASGKMERSPRRDFYLPLAYLEPPVEEVRGLEIMFEPVRRREIETAIDQGKMHVSHRFRLVEDPEGVQSVAVYVPGYRQSLPRSTPEERRVALLGVGVALFRLRPLIESALSQQKREGVSLALVDPQAPSDVRVLYETEPGIAFGATTRAVHREAFDFGNRRYTVVSVTHLSRGYSHWLALSLGLGLTGIATATYFAFAMISGLRRTVARTMNLGQYTLEEKIGEGGMGVVYRAAHAMLRRPAAIKLLLKESVSESDLARFEREVQLTSRLAHPNTISIFDYGRTADGVFYYVMEFLDGLDLDRLVREDGPLEPGRAIRVLAQVSGALAEAHMLGLIHRDIKPANIVLTERRDEPDVVKVVDFGLVKTLEPVQGEPGITQVNAITGTPLYLAPEAISAPQAMDGRTDLYSLGAVAYFMLTGEHVFSGSTVVEVLTKHLLEEPQPPSLRSGRELPADLEALVLACLAKDPAARPASAEALRDALLACQVQTPYDMAAARKWWAERGALLRASARSGPRGVGHATTMKIDVQSRPFHEAPTTPG